MRTRYRFLFYFAVICGLASLPAVVSAETQSTKKTAKPKAEKQATISETTLPEKVRKTFVDKFPNAKIEKAESEKEGGIMVWDIEFRDGRKHKETDIAEDGRMLESSEQVTQKSVPKDAMRAIKKAVEGGKLIHTEKVEVLYEIKDGKWTKLDKPKTQYEANATKGEQNSDIIVDDKGKILEEPKWSTEKKNAKSA
jgi:hypothetical protein